MKFLLDIPFVMYIARSIWGEAEDVTEEICVEEFPLMSMPCWSTLIAKLLGIGIILGAFLNKAPVIVNLIDTESTAGLSRGSVYADTLVYANGFSYGHLEGHPITAYGENAALLIQSFAIVILIWKFTQDVPLLEKIAVALAGMTYVSVVSFYLPAYQHYLLIASQWPIMIFARGSQIWATYQAKHTGAQSVITTLLNLAGSSVRILTTLQEVGWDLPVLSGFALGLFLNSIALMQFIMYWDNTKEFLKKLDVERKTDEYMKNAGVTKQSTAKEPATKKNTTKKKEL